MAVEVAAMRRGCVWPISPVPPAPMPRPIDRQILGNCVVLPEPVSPLTITTWCAAMAWAISSRRAETGSASGKAIGGTALARARRASSAAASASGVGFCRRGRRPPASAGPGWRAGRLASFGEGREGAADGGETWESDIGRDYNPRIFSSPARAPHRARRHTPFRP
ncbi:hypothetical protein [Ralstonia solanacearum]|uniref:hypothetical protein n=1 Tax=Ralstonia solanacearum TaxID=305 RepID=UPI001FFC878C|nr:hypothetical protein [Ralstonia solanacearum]